MGHSSSWEAKLFTSSQETTRNFWYPKGNYHIHKSPPPVPIFSQINPVHNLHPNSWRSILIFSSFHLSLAMPDTVYKFVDQKRTSIWSKWHNLTRPVFSEFEIRKESSNTRQIRSKQPTVWWSWWYWWR